MTILTRHVTREVIRGLVAALAILSGLLLVRRVLRAAELAVLHGFDPFETAKLVLWCFPPVLLYALPMSALLASLLAFGRMRSDRELTALLAGGIPFRSTITPLIVIAVLLGAFSFADAAILSPLAYRAFDQAAVGGAADPIKALSPGTLSAIAGRTIWAGEIDPSSRELRNIYLGLPDEGGVGLTATAPEASWIIDEYGVAVTLHDGTIYQERSEGALRTLSFSNYTVMIPWAYSGWADSPKRSLLSELLGKEGTAEEEAELHRRFSIPLAAPIFILLGAGWAAAGPGKRGTRGKLGEAVILYGAYYLLLMCAEFLIIKHGAPAILIYIPDIAGAAAGIILIAGAERPA